MEKRLVCIVIVFSCITPCYSGIFDWFSPAKPKSKVEQLEEKLVDYPQDPEINYNLGVAYYKDKKLNDAIQCFKRAFDYGTDLEIKKRSSFNAGNGLYQSVLAGLPYNWEKKETNIDPQLLIQSIMMAKDVIEQYKKTLSIDPVDIKAKTNKKKAEELLKKLQDKQQQKPQDKQDKQDKKDNQHNKDQQQDPNQQQEQQGDQSKQEKNKGDQNSQNDQQQGQGKDEMKSPSEQQKEAGDKGLDKQESQQKQETKQDHEQTPQQKPEGQQQSPRVQDKADEGKEQAAAAGAQDQKNSEEKRALGAILDSLKNDEKGLQKGLMMREMQKKQQKDPIKSGQKQW